MHKATLMHMPHSAAHLKQEAPDVLLLQQLALLLFLQFHEVVVQVATLAELTADEEVATFLPSFIGLHTVVVVSDMLRVYRLGTQFICIVGDFQSFVHFR